MRIFENKDKIEDYFNYFIDKTYDLIFKKEFGKHKKEVWKIKMVKRVYDLIFKKEFGKHKKEVWKIKMVKRVKDYVAASISEPGGKFNSDQLTMRLTMVFCKNFPNGIQRKI